MPSPCWMCENCTSEEVKNFHQFIVDRAHTVDASEMARHMHEHLVSQHTSCAIDAVPPPEASEILVHIRRHMLHPKVRVAQILRNLLELSETLQELVLSQDEDGKPLIDVRTVTVYLKVVSEIMQIYKTADLSKMLFSEMDV